MDNEGLCISNGVEIEVVKNEKMLGKVTINSESYHSMPEAIQQELGRLFDKHRVLDMNLLKRHFAGRSTISLYRDLKEAKSLSSYTHAGKYYTLRRIAKFSVRGLWHYDEIGFSQHGTLRATLVYLVNTSIAGYTYSELKERLMVRVGNALRELVNDKLLRREGSAGQYLYFSVDKQRAAKQKEQRQQLQREALLPLP